MGHQGNRAELGPAWMVVVQQWSSYVSVRSDAVLSMMTIDGCVLEITVAGMYKPLDMTGVGCWARITAEQLTQAMRCGGILRLEPNATDGPLPDWVYELTGVSREDDEKRFPPAPLVAPAPPKAE
jgi:hypothetical protein